MVAGAAAAVEKRDVGVEANAARVENGVAANAGEITRWGAERWSSGARKSAVAEKRRERHRILRGVCLESRGTK